MNIILDSNIFIEDFKLNGNSFNTFLEAHESIGHKLFVPRVVLDEVVNKFSETLNGSRKKLIKL